MSKVPGALAQIAAWQGMHRRAGSPLMSPLSWPALKPRLKGCVEAGLSFIYPEACQCCGLQRATAADGYVCAGCRESLKFIRPPFCERCGLPYGGAITNEFECTNCRLMKLHFSHARSVVAAQGLTLEIIHRYKYQRALWFEPFLAGLLIDHATEALREGQWDLIVPVPLHPSKQAEREFNQAERLARRLGRATQIPVHTRLVRRVVPTLTQTRLSVSERAKNVQRAFAAGSEKSCQGRRVVLVDDVFTTGATTSACARVLRAAGAAEVCVWTVARGLLR